MIKRALPLFVLAIICFSNFADADLFGKENSGGGAEQFFEQGGGARALGMGTANTASASDASATYWNPASLPALNRKDLIVYYAPLLEDTAFNSISYAHPTKFGGFGASVLSLQSGSFQGVDENGQTIGELNSATYGALLSYGFPIFGRAAIGTTIKAVRQELGEYNDTGAGGDVGVRVQLTSIVGAGLMLENVVQPRLGSETFPRIARVGAELKLIKNLILASDVAMGSEGADLRAGVEFSILELVVLRTGVNEREVSAGMGFNVGQWGLDYAVGYPYAFEELSGSHHVSLHVNFGRPVNAAPLIGRQPRSDEQLAADAQLLEDLRFAMREVPPKNTPDLIQRTTTTIAGGGFRKSSELREATGYLLFLERNYTGSAQQLKKAYESDSENALLEENYKIAETQARYASSNQTQEISHTYSTQNWPLTIALSESALTVNPDHVEAAIFWNGAVQHQIEIEVRTAQTEIDEGRFVEAYIRLRKMQELEPENREIKNYLRRLGKALDRKGELEKLVNAAPEGSQNAWAANVTHYMEGLKRFTAGAPDQASSQWKEALKGLDRDEPLYEFIKKDLSDLRTEDPPKKH